MLFWIGICFLQNTDLQIKGPYDTQEEADNDYETFNNMFPFPKARVILPIRASSEHEARVFLSSECISD